MTYPEFLEALRQTPRDWVVTEWGGIRRGNLSERQCPMSSLVNLNAGSWRKAAKELELEESVGRDIADGADSTTPEAPWAAIRRDLLRACGLTEGEK